MESQKINLNHQFLPTNYAHILKGNNIPHPLSTLLINIEQILKLLTDLLITITSTEDLKIILNSKYNNQLLYNSSYIYMYTNFEMYIYRYKMYYLKSLHWNSNGITDYPKDSMNLTVSF